MLQRLVKNVTSPAASTSGHGGILSVISPNVRIIGDIVSQGEVHVDGEIDGNISCQILTVGEGARISGEITAESVRVHGDVTGKINAAVVSITRSARVLGDIHHESLEIEVGAYFEGHCVRRPGSQQTELKRLEAQVPFPPKAADAVAATSALTAPVPSTTVAAESAEEKVT